MDDIIWPPKKSAGPKTKLKLKLQTPVLEETPPPDSETTFPGITPDAEEEQPVTNAKEEVQVDAATNNGPVAKDVTQKTAKKHRWLYFRRKHLSKKQWLVFATIALILLGAAVYGAMTLYKHFRTLPPQPPQAPIAKKEVPPPPTTEPSRLTGIEVPFDSNKRPVTGIMIENSPDARPQSGLKDAGIVYEAIAEGGITRFLTLFQEARPDYIGPVRSVRPYYLDFLWPFDAGIAHVGGAPQALADIKSLGIRDLDQFANSGSYWRVTGRYAPHNVYTSFDKLDELNNKKGFTSSTFTSFLRKKAEPLKTPTVQSIDLNISGPLYNVHYDYDVATNSYKRSEAGKPHVDEKSGAQLAPSVVMALIMTRGIAGDGQHTDYGTTGIGHMYVFQDGGIIEGSWAKATRKDQFVFTEAATGKPLPLNPGQTWLTIVDANSDVFYK